MSNEIIGNLGAEDPRDPLAIAEVPDELIQSALRDRMESVAQFRSTNYQTFPLYGESFLVAIIRSMFEGDEAFRYDVDPMKSRIVISTSYNRNTIKDRDLRPLIVVAFQSAMGDEVVMGNTFKSEGVNQPKKDTKGVMDTSNFRVSVLHHNRNLALFLGQQVRVEIASNIEIMRQVFGLQKVFPPSIQGPGELEEYDDLFGAFVDVRVQYMPKWEVKKKPEHIRKIVLATMTTAGEIMQEAIIEDPGTKGKV